MLPLEVIRKYYPDLSDEDLKKIQVFIYELCCGLMQYFHGNDWEKDSEDLDFKSEEDRYGSLNISSNLVRVQGYRFNFR